MKPLYFYQYHRDYFSEALVCVDWPRVFECVEKNDKKGAMEIILSQIFETIEGLEDNLEADAKRKEKHPADEVIEESRRADARQYNRRIL